MELIKPFDKGDYPTTIRICWHDPMPDRPELKIAICGKAPSSLGLAPFDDESWEIWTLNDTNHKRQVPRWSRHFELHDIELTKDPAYKGYYEDWLCHDQGGKPIYMQEQYPECPSCVPYPRREILELFPRRYFTNSISWMIALAIHEGATHINLYGVDMAQHGVGGKSEYARQRPSCEYFVGIAEGLGVKVGIADASDLLHCRNLYGFDNGQMEAKFRAREKELQERINSHAAAVNSNREHELYLRGAADQLMYDKQWFYDQTPKGD